MTIPELYINYINYAVIGFLILAIIIGLWKGFLRQVISLIATIFAFVSAKLLTPMLVGYVQIIKVEMIPDDLAALSTYICDKANYLLCFALTFIVLIIIFKLLIPLVVKIADLPVIKIVDRLLGAIISIIIYAFIIILISYVISLPIFTNGQEVIDNTLLKPAGAISNVIFDSVNDTVIDVVQKVNNGEEITINELIETVKEIDLDQETIINIIKEYDLSLDDINKYFEEKGISKEQIAEEYNIDVDEILKSLKNE